MQQDDRLAEYFGYMLDRGTLPFEDRGMMQEIPRDLMDELRRRRELLLRHDIEG